MKARGYALALGLAFVVLACADLFGFKDLHEADASQPDVFVPDAAPDVDTCAHALWQGPPDATDLGTGTDYTFAVRHVYFTTTPDGGTSNVGYDIDHHCTSDLASSSCVPPGGNVVVDNAGGVDNESIQLLNTLINAQSSVAGSLSDPSLNGTIANGDFTMLFRLFGYRGGANQPSSTGLSFAFQASPGIVNAPPSFDGGDRWQVAAEDVVGGLDAGTNFPTLLITTTYVNNRVLVVNYGGSVALRLVVPGGSTVSGPLVVNVSKPLLTATLVPRGDGRFDLANGVITGRWPASDMLKAIAQLDIKGQALCSYLNGLAFPIVASTLCAARDINGSGVDDDSLRCDAVSVAIAFDAVAANVSGSPTPFPVSATPCADAGVCAD